MFQIKQELNEQETIVHHDRLVPVKDEMVELDVTDSVNDNPVITDMDSSDSEGGDVNAPINDNVNRS